MATEAQLDFFRLAYDEEVAREKQIRETAKTYLTLITFYAAFLVFVHDKIDGRLPGYGRAVLLTAVLFLGLGFALSIWAAKTANYEVLLDPERMLRELDDGPVSDEEFYDRRIADFTFACDRNGIVNDGKAQAVSRAGYALLAGIAAHAVFFVLFLSR